MFNTDYHGYPAKGAPHPHFVSVEYNAVCNVCWELYICVDRKHFRELEQKQPSRFQTNRWTRLSPLSDYLSCF